MRTYKLHKLFDSVEISVFDVCSFFNYGQSTFHSIPANLFDFDRERKVVKPKDRGRNFASCITKIGDITTGF